MKFIALVVLFAAVFACDPQIPNEKTWVDVVKCVLDKSDVILPEVVDLIEAIRDKDYLKVISIVAKLYDAGQSLYNECFAETMLAFNWPVFGECLLRNGASEIPALIDVVKAIIAKEWEKVATLVAQVAIKVIPIVYIFLRSKLDQL